MRVTYRDVNDTPYATLPVLLEDMSDVFRVCKITSKRVNYCALFVLLRCVWREVVARYLGYTFEGSRM